MKEKKKAIDPKPAEDKDAKELPEEKLELVAGGVVIPPPLVEDAAYMVTATAECKKCPHTFNYQYNYYEGCTFNMTER